MPFCAIPAWGVGVSWHRPALWRDESSIERCAMPSEQSSTLSAYLLNEANKWQVYPSLTMRRTKINLESREALDAILTEFVEWRRTFVPHPKYLGKEAPNEPILWNDRYCREVLQKVPEMVRRRRAIRQLPLAPPSDAPWWVCLRESATCLIYGARFAHFRRQIRDLVPESQKETILTSK